MKLFDDTYFTHMPFVFEGQLLHCKATKRTRPTARGDGSTTEQYQGYDIYCSDLDGADSFYIGTNLGDDIIACSPNAYRDPDGNIVLNYVAAPLTTACDRYFHYQRKGPSLRELSAQQVVPEPRGIPNYCQSENQWFSYTTAASPEQSYVVQYDKIGGRHRFWKLENLSMLTRAVVLDERSVVLTYVNSSQEAASALFETDTRLVMDIKVRGKHVYKSHLYEGRVFHSVRAPGADYGMAIHRDSYTLEPSDLKVTASPWM